MNYPDKGIQDVFPPRLCCGRTRIAANQRYNIRVALRSWLIFVFLSKDWTNGLVIDNFEGSTFQAYIFLMILVFRFGIGLEGLRRVEILYSHAGF